MSTKKVPPAPRREVKGRRAPFCAAKAKHKVKINNEALGAKIILKKNNKAYSSAEVEFRVITQYKKKVKKKILKRWKWKFKNHVDQERKEAERRSGVDQKEVLGVCVFTDACK